jgi:hypothetical protein
MPGAFEMLAVAAELASDIDRYDDSLDITTAEISA